MSISSAKAPATISEHIVEVVSDSGEGAQRCGQSLGAIAAKLGNGIWTVEIIPAEIQPPARSIQGASGVRIRIGRGPVTNGGDETDLVVAFNEQVLLGRLRAGEFKPGATILLESMWRDDDDPAIAASYAETVADLLAAGFRVIEIPMEVECRKLVANPRQGKNMFVLGILCDLYSLDLRHAREQVRITFGKKDERVVRQNLELLEAGWAWAEENLDFCYEIPAQRTEQPQIVSNGNTALALGILASGMDICAMYPITPATSASHYLIEIFDGARRHRPSGRGRDRGVLVRDRRVLRRQMCGHDHLRPGLLAQAGGDRARVDGEIPLVVIDVQRGGPSTGLPTKIEQGDLQAAIFGSHGDAPKVVIAASSIEDCFYSVITARKIAEEFNIPVVLLSDASLATAQTPFPRPLFSDAWLAPPVDRTPVAPGIRPYDWDPVTGIARRIMPGQPGGMHTLTGLAHDRDSHVAYDADSNEDGLRHRSLKLVALQKTLRPPAVFGDPDGDLLMVGWGSTKGLIEEAVERLRGEGLRVSSLHLRFLQPLPPGIKEIMQRFEQVLAIEGAWSDRPQDELVDDDNRRYTPLAMILRSRYLVDVDCWGEARGAPMKPATVCDVVRSRLLEGALR